MATADQIKSLIRSYTKDNSEQFYTVALQVAAHELSITTSVRIDFPIYAIPKDELQAIRQGNPINARFARPLPLARFAGTLVERVFLD